MSYVRFNISDRNVTISGELHGSMTDPMIASLTAEPETVEEYESALHRYVKSESDWPPLHGFRKHEDLEPYDAGIVAIDLPGRTVGYESTYSLPSAEGSVRVPAEFSEDDDDVYIPYRLPDDWMFIKSIPMYEGTSLMRRGKRSANAPFDARPILFGRPMITHIARAIREASDLDAEDLFGDIHADWLMTARQDLHGQTPREVLLAKQEFIDFDLHTRSLQWSFTKVCPAPLKKESFAYINAGFGTHEWVLYYDLVRYLLVVEAERRGTGQMIADLESEIAHLSTLRNEWLRTPDSESFGRVPLEVIDLERRRINMTASAKEILIDEDCPCCVALAEDFDTPMFWHLDGCNMDDRFEFSVYRTREEWEEAERSREEFDREFDRKYRENPEFWKADEPF